MLTKRRLIHTALRTDPFWLSTVLSAFLMPVKALCGSGVRHISEDACRFMQGQGVNDVKRSWVQLSEAQVPADECRLLQGQGVSGVKRMRVQVGRVCGDERFNDGHAELCAAE